MSWARLVLTSLGAIVQSVSVYAKPVFTELETRQHVREYADCVVSRHSVQVKTMFALDWRNRDILRHGGSLISEDCAGKIAGIMGIQMKFAMDTYRYALADALVRREFSNLSPIAVGLAVVADEFPTPPDPATLPANKHRADEIQRAYGAKFLEVYGDCIVKRAPAESLALLRTMDGKPEETAAFATLRSTLAACLPANNTVRFSRFPLRGAIAMSYAQAAVVTSSGSRASQETPHA